jgi:lipoprotein signal peptidase
MRTKGREIGIMVVALLDLFLQTSFRSIGFGVANRGVSFGLAPEMGLLISFGAWLGFALMAKKGKVEYWLILIGGAGNIISRIIWGSVWDYICWLGLPFCFNLCDGLISFGVLSYILRGDEYRGFVRRRQHTGN